MKTLFIKVGFDDNITCNFYVILARKKHNLFFFPVEIIPFVFMQIHCDLVSFQHFQVYSSDASSPGKPFVICSLTQPFVELKTSLKVSNVELWMPSLCAFFSQSQFTVRLFFGAFSPHSHRSLSDSLARFISEPHH